MTGTPLELNGWRGDTMENRDSADPIRIDTRLSGQIKRYHTWPIIGQQTIAEHTWQLLRIYFAVEKEPDIRVIYSIVFHDVGETKTGDMPYPIKRDNPALKEMVDGLEARSQADQMEYWGSFRQNLVTPKEYDFLKQIHLIEMWEFGLDQVNMGNAYAFIIADRCLKSLYEQNPSVPIRKYVITRLRLWGIQCPTCGIYDTANDWWRSYNW